MSETYFEYRGVDQFHISKITKDDKTGYETETPVYFQPVSEIGKTTDTLGIFDKSNI